MENRIAENIVERLSRHFTPSYIYTEQSSLPYCVYEITQESPVYAKSGIIGYKAECTVYLAAATEAASVEMKDNALAVLAERDKRFAINISSVQPAFGEDQWLQKIDFQVTQLS
jgi:hypothetical protein